MEKAWFYDSPATVAGTLQRGLGRGLRRALRESAGDLVMACLRRDYRWWWIVDERAVYLARLVRDLALPVGSVLSLLDTVDDGDNTFSNVTDVLAILGRGGDTTAIDGLRQHVRHGPQCVTVLQTIAREWPRDQWDDLRPVCRSRMAQHGWDGDALWNANPGRHGRAWTNQSRPGPGRDDGDPARRAQDAWRRPKNSFQRFAPAPSMSARQRSWS